MTYKQIDELRREIINAQTMETAHQLYKRAMDAQLKYKGRNMKLYDGLRATKDLARIKYGSFFEHNQTAN